MEVEKEVLIIRIVVGNGCYVTHLVKVSGQCLSKIDIILSNYLSQRTKQYSLYLFYGFYLENYRKCNSCGVHWGCVFGDIVADIYDPS